MKRTFMVCMKCIAVFMLLFFAGCGSDSSSQEPVKESSSEQEPEENLSPGDSTDLDDEENYIESKLAAMENFSIDSVRDAYGSYTYWIRTGNVVWSIQKITEQVDEVESVCYGKQKGNCDDYGRLFSAKENPAHASCPDDMNLPSAKDWMLLDAYRSEHSEIDKLMALKYGGSCVKTEDSLKCTGKDSVGNYLTSDGKVYTIKKGKSVASVVSAKKNGYYNVRCVTYAAFVKSKKDLPACDSSLRNPPELIYVFEEKENYRCYTSKNAWYPDLTENCDGSGKKMVFNDTMMICEDRIWQLADISDSPEECNSKNKEKNLVFNGEKYTCNGSKWRRFDSIEDTLGVCNSRKKDAFDTLYAGSKIRLYYCNGTKWDDATIENYKGDCLDSSSKNMYDTIDFKNDLYVCRGNGWEEYTDFEKQFGVCVPRKLFMFENGSYDVDDHNTEYLCDTTGWIKFTPNDIIGRCDSTEWGWYTIYRDKHYLCDKYHTWVHYGGINSSITRNSERVNDGDLEKCTTENYGQIAESKEFGSVGCDEDGWRTINSSEKKYGLCGDKNENEIIEKNGKKVICYWFEWSGYKDKSEYRVNGSKKEGK